MAPSDQRRNHSSQQWLRSFSWFRNVVLLATMTVATVSISECKQNGIAHYACTKTTHNHSTLKKALGSGPARFALNGERTIEEQISSLSPEQRACFDALKARWEEKDRGYTFDDAMYLRFARCSPGPTKFNEKTAWKVMKSFDHRNLTIRAEELEKQLLTKSIFVVPELQTKEGHDLFYFRCSCYFPFKTASRDIIDNLTYCLQVMVEKEKACTEGIALMVNLVDYGVRNFSLSVARQLAKVLHGRVPVRVRKIIIVNPPGYFAVAWGLVEPFLPKDFRQKVQVIPATELPNFLGEGWEETLPDDVNGGKAPTDQMISDFLTYRKFVEDTQ